MGEELPHTIFNIDKLCVTIEHRTSAVHCFKHSISMHRPSYHTVLAKEPRPLIRLALQCV